MPLLYAQTAMFRALTEEGPDSLAYRLCSYAYGTGVDLVDYDGLLADVAAGRATEPPAMPTTDVQATVEGLAKVLGAVFPTR